MIKSESLLVANYLVSCGWALFSLLSFFFFFFNHYIVPYVPEDQIIKLICLGSQRQEEQIHLSFRSKIWIVHIEVEEEEKLKN